MQRSLVPSSNLGPGLSKLFSKKQVGTKFKNVYSVKQFVRASQAIIIFVILMLSISCCGNSGEEQDLVIESGHTKVIEDSKIVLNGSIIVEPDATLIIRKSDITINSHYKNQYWIKVYSGATLIVEDSILREGPVPGLGEVGKFGRIDDFRLGETCIEPRGENTTIVLRNTSSELRIGAGNGRIIIDSSYISIIFWRPSSNEMRISNSSIALLHIWLHGGKEEEVNLSHLCPQEKGDFNVSIENSTLEVRNCSVQRYAVAIWVPPGDTRCRKDVTIEDSELSEIFIVFPIGTDVTLTDMKPGLYKEWDIHDVLKGDIPWNLTLINVSLQKWKIDFHGKAEISDSEFHLDTWGNVNVVVRDSRIVSNLHSRGGYVRLINTTISDFQGLTCVRFLNGSDVLGYMPAYIYEFVNSTIGPNAELSFTDEGIHVVFKGNLTMKLSLDKIHWFAGTLTRDYEVILLDENDKPQPNRKVSLYLDNYLLWEKSTDEKGVIHFNLTFNKDNHAEKYLLTASCGENVTREIWLLSDTPIVIRKGEESQATPFCFAISIVAIVFAEILLKISRKRI